MATPKDYPDFVARYLELIEGRRRMRAAFKAQEEQVNKAIEQCEEHAQAWLKQVPKETIPVQTESDEEKRRFGTDGYLQLKRTQDKKSLNPQILTNLLNAFLCARLTQLGVNPQVAAEVAAQSAQYCWTNRPAKQERVEIHRGFTKKRKVREILI